MPIYMDRHDVAEEVSAEIVARLHQEDLKIQHKYGCKGLTYWYDDQRKTAFCLVEAPNKEAIVEMHSKAHGEVPNTIIEVDGAIVESFLGRIEDPKKSQKKELNIINDPAFRVIMVLKISQGGCLKAPSGELLQELKEVLDHYSGRLVKYNGTYFLVSYYSTSNAVNAALAIRKFVTRTAYPNLKIHIGIGAGVPVTKEPGLFEETIHIAEGLCSIANKYIVVTSEVKDLYESENLNVNIDSKQVIALTLSDEYFWSYLNRFIKKEWKNPNLNIASICKELGFSTSQLYRKITAISGKSTNTFLQDYRLEKAMELLQRKELNISEIAIETSFNSAAYFAKCFRKKFGISPSEYLKKI